MTDEAKALVEREGMQVLLPPASIDGDYLMGWLEGQSYLIANYGTDEAFDQAIAVANKVHKLQDLIETQAREIEQWKVDYNEAALDVERLTKWKPIETAPDDDWFLAAIEVRHKNGGHWWEYHVVWLDDETGDIHTDCEQGWSITDYSHWMALPNAPYPLNAARAALAGDRHDQ